MTTTREANTIEMARAVLQAVGAAEQAMFAINRALITADGTGTACYGFAEFMTARRALAAVISEHGLRFAADNELRALGANA